MRMGATARLECLDGLRGLLAFYVLLGHMAPFAVLPDWLQSLVSHGGAAVDIFFILSGLVITQSLLRAGGRPAAFLIARAVRIYPVYLAVFLPSVLLAPWSCGFEHMAWIGPDNPARTICVMAWPHAWLPEIAAHLTMTQGLFPAAVLPDVWVSFLGAAWSLSTEWQFYLLALLTLLATGRDDDWGSRLCRMLIVLTAAGTIWHLMAPQPWQFSRAFLPNKAHLFALGVASLPLVRRQPAALAGYGLVLAMALLTCGTQGALGKLLPPLVWSACLAAQLQPSWFGLHLAARLLCSRPALYLGRISYCLYLVNEPIHKLAGAILGPLAGGDSLLFTVIWLPAAILLPLLAAAWLHHALEAPALRWGSTLLRSSPPPVTAGVIGGSAARARSSEVGPTSDVNRPLKQREPEPDGFNLKLSGSIAPCSVAPSSIAVSGQARAPGL